MPEFGRTLGEELLTPTRVYAADLLALIRADGVDVHSLSHVTGGGLAANLARVLPDTVLARVDRSTWTPPAVFTTLQQLGNVPRDDIERTLNMGVGFVAVLPERLASTAPRAVLAERGIRSWAIGDVQSLDGASLDSAAEVVRGAKGVDGGSVQVVGDHPSA